MLFRLVLCCSLLICPVACYVLLVVGAAGDYVNDNTLTVYIKRLRDKIEDDPQNPSIIRTVRGLGYRVGDEA